MVTYPLTYTNKIISHIQVEVYVFMYVFFLKKKRSPFLCLKHSNVGCFVSNHIINHTTYADGICLLAPCAKPSQTLVDICTSYNEEHDVTYNTKKYVCLMIKSHKCAVLLIYDTNLNY